MATIIREPEVTMTLSSAIQRISNTDQKVLIVGQKLGTDASNSGAATTSVSGTLYTNLGSQTSVNASVGSGSHAANMYLNFRKINGVTRVDMIPLSDNGTTKATGTFVFSGTASADGTLSFIVGSESDHTYVMDIVSGTTASANATALAALINADFYVAVTATASSGTVTMTARNAGTLGNLIGLAIDGTVAGVTMSCTAMTGGATDPSVTTLFDVITNARYQTIGYPYITTRSTLSDFLDNRWNATNDILDGVGIITTNQTYANALTLLDAENSQSLTIFVDEPITETYYKAPSVLETTWTVSAQMAAIRSLKLTTGASTSGLVIAGTGSNDRVGGMHMASFPYFNMPTQMSPRTSGASSRGFTQEEQTDIKDAGGAIYGNNISGNTIILGEVATTYKTDAQSTSDVTFKFLEYVDTSSVCREYFSNNCRSRFGQTRLTLGGVNPNSSMVNVATIEAYMSQLYQDLANLTLVQDGEEFSLYFRNNLNITINMATGSCTAQMKLPIVTQLRQLIADIEITFNI